MTTQMKRVPTLQYEHIAAQADSMTSFKGTFPIYSIADSLIVSLLRVSGLGFFIITHSVPSMEDTKNPKTTPLLSLPPGCRFFPSEEQLLSYYLAKKNSDSSSDDSDCGFGVIKVINLCDYEPFDLPEITSFSYGYRGRRRHWYCYMSRAWGKGNKRRAGAGFWKRKGGARDVMGGKGGKVVLGQRKSFVFYLRNPPNLDSRTDWVMHEYALNGKPEASFVLCRVFVKSCSRNNTSEHGLSSCAEESVATVKHIGIQHDGSMTRENEGKSHYDDSVDEQNEILRFPAEQSSRLNDQVAAGPASIDGFQYSLGISPNILFSSRGFGRDGVGLIDAMPTHQPTSLLEEDFIELDDLVCQLSDAD